MDSSRFGNWLQVIGNLGLIAGLVLVAVQINQNTELSRAQMISEGWLSAAEDLDARAAENPTSSIARAQTDPHQLTQEDMIILDGLATAEWLRTILVEKISLLGYEVLPIEDMSRIFVRQQLGNPFAMAWWESSGDLAANAPNTLDRVNEILAELGTTGPHRHRLESIRNAMRAAAPR